MSRKSKSIRKRVKRTKKELMELDITSLLDILVILLVFLLKTYNTSNIIIQVPDEIKLPKSASESPNHDGVNIQLSKEKIWVGPDEIVDFVKNPNNVKIYDHGGRLIIPLYDHLVKVKEEVKLAKAQAGVEEKFSGIANLVVDKEVKYIEIKRILYTAAEAGFQKYKFVVLAEEQP